MKIFVVIVAVVALFVIVMAHGHKRVEPELTPVQEAWEKNDREVTPAPFTCSGAQAEAGECEPVTPAPSAIAPAPVHPIIAPITKKEFETYQEYQARARPPLPPLRPVAKPPAKEVAKALKSAVKKRPRKSVDCSKVNSYVNIWGRDNVLKLGPNFVSADTMKLVRKCLGA